MSVLIVIDGIDVVKGEREVARSVCKRLDLSRRNASPERERRNDGPGKDYRPSRHDTALANMNIVEHRGVDADEAVVIDLRPVDDGTVTNGDTIANVRLGQAEGAMEDGTVLNVGVVANDYLAHVAPQDSGKPNGGAVADGDIAND